MIDEHLRVYMSMRSYPAIIVSKADIEVGVTRPLDTLLGADVFGSRKDGNKAIAMVSSYGDFKRAFNGHELLFGLDHEKETREDIQDPHSIFDNEIDGLRAAALPLLLWFAGLDHYIHSQTGMSDWLVDANAAAIEAADAYFKNGF